MASAPNPAGRWVSLAPKSRRTRTKAPRERDRPRSNSEAESTVWHRCGRGRRCVFVGAKRKAVVDQLVDLYDTVRTDQRPAMVVIESETGLGKTKILQEFYARLAADRQGVPPYWPERL